MVSIVFISVIFINNIPVKRAIKYGNIDRNNTFILIKANKATVSKWFIYEDNSQQYNVPIPVRLNEDILSGYNYTIDIADNMFVCYGEYTEDKDLKGVIYKNFNVSSWNIINPIKRDSIFESLFPKKHLNFFDTIK